MKQLQTGDNSDIQSNERSTDSDTEARPSPTPSSSTFNHLVLGRVPHDAGTPIQGPTHRYMTFARPDHHHPGKLLKPYSFHCTTIFSVRSNCTQSSSTHKTKGCGPYSYFYFDDVWMCEVWSRSHVTQTESFFHGCSHFGNMCICMVYADKNAHMCSPRFP